ncbi:MAG: hypothetical protein BWY65_00467 [Firmicutes bacterium ADurb.Bin373]|nr:MAG: hypothetical protein BWY65_00467 [Firmicutes bacterium ADurb.Bin373]
MDDPRHLGAVLNFHRHHIAAIPDGHNGVLQVFLVIWRADYVFQVILYAQLGAGQLSTCLRKCRRGVVGDLAAGQNSVFDQFFQIRQGCNKESMPI